MSPEMGEYVVGAVLRLIENCDVVDYNVRPPGGGMAGLGELGLASLTPWVFDSRIPPRSFARSRRTFEVSSMERAMRARSARSPRSRRADERTLTRT